VGVAWTDISPVDSPSMVAVVVEEMGVYAALGSSSSHVHSPSVPCTHPRREWEPDRILLLLVGTLSIFTLLVEDGCNTVDDFMYREGNGLDGMMTPLIGKENDDAGDDDADSRHHDIENIAMLFKLLVGAMIIFWKNSRGIESWRLN